MIENLTNYLPDKLLISVFRCLSPEELAVASLVCKKFYEIASDHALWRQHCWSEFRYIPESKGKEYYEELLFLGKMHNICMKVVYFENYFHQLGGWTGMFYRMYRRGEFNRNVRRLHHLNTQLEECFGEGLTREECIFHSMVNWYFVKGKAIETSHFYDAVKLFLNSPPPSAIGKYTVKGRPHLFVRLKREEAKFFLSIPSISDQNPENWYRVCFGELFKIDRVEADRAFESHRVDTLTFFEKDFNIPDYNLYRTVRSFFDPNSTFAENTPVELLKGMQVDVPDTSNATPITG